MSDIIGKILITGLGIAFFLVPEGASSVIGIGIIGAVWGFDFWEAIQ